MIPVVIAKIETDETYALDQAATDLADAFRTIDGLQKNYRHFRDYYAFMREQPELSRLVFDTLVAEHNMRCGGDDLFVPGCCCCGIDPYEPERQLSKDIDPIASALDGAAFVDYMESYRKKAHARDAPIAALGSSKNGAGAVLFARLTSKTAINEEEAKYIYAVLERNECIADELIEYAIAGGRIIELSEREQIVQSPVVDAISGLFDPALRPGGGCCCCCCCCCCGGGC